MDGTTTRRLPLAARVLAGGTWVWLLFAVVHFTDAACSVFAFFDVAATGLVLGFLWISFTALDPWLLRRYVWLSVPFAGALAVGLALTDWGLVLRVALCEADLADCAATVSAGRLPEDLPGRVGLFHVDWVTRYDGGVYFYTSTSFLNRHGVAHLPPGAKPAPRTSIRHLYGRWYSFEWFF
jgi:hypothetical protein